MLALTAAWCQPHCHLMHVVRKPVCHTACSEHVICGVNLKGHQQFYSRQTHQMCNIYLPKSHSINRVLTLGFRLGARCLWQSRVRGEGLFLEVLKQRCRQPQMTYYLVGSQLLLISQPKNIELNICTQKSFT